MTFESCKQATEILHGTLHLNMKEADYDIDGNTVFFSSQYFVDELFQQTVVLRKKL